MEEKERSRSRSPHCRSSRVQQVVGTILRRTRESLSRERILGDGRSERSGSVSSQNFPVRLTVQVTRDPVLDPGGHGFTLTPYLPLLVRDVTTGGPADGLLFPGDQVLQVNDTPTEELSSEQLDDMMRGLEDSVTMTILRHLSGPKSSIMSAEKRARLRTNPVKVRFAEEVVVNGHTQGNSLLFLPNVLKVYLENGQTKAFKFDHTTMVKDIIMTLKDKLSIRSIEYFALALEQQYSITKLLLLHEDELIQKVVQKKDSHDYRCLFRVCFIPRDPMDLMQDDPTAFEYLFLQSVGDVLQERFAVEMKCNTALRLAALHMHERLDSCGQTRTSIKSIKKEFGLDSFISPTLLSNMREKDLTKAISYHLKKIQALLEPRQKVISATQARLAYLTQLGELISYGGRSYNATMMLQDREALVSLLVGARYGLSQVVNHKLNMVSTLVDFSSISRVELLSESDRVSLLRISLHDMKPFALLMDSMAAKDLACLLGGYCKLLVDPNVSVLRLGRPKVRVHRIPAEEGYVSRCCSDSDDSSDSDYSAEQPAARRRPAAGRDRSREREEPARGGEDRVREKRREREKDGQPEVKIIVTADVGRDGGDERGEEEGVGEGEGARSQPKREQEALLDTNWYHTDPRVNSSFSSLSSGSLSAALEESEGAAAARADPAKTPSSSSRLTVLREEEGGLGPRPPPRPVEGLSHLDVPRVYLLEVTPPPLREGVADQDRAAAVGVASAPVRPTALGYRGGGGADSSCLCFAELSQADFLPSPPEATSDEEGEEEEEEEEEEGGTELRRITKIPSHRDLRLVDSEPFHSALGDGGAQMLLPRMPHHHHASSCADREDSSSAREGVGCQQRHSKEEEEEGLFLTPSPNARPRQVIRESGSESEDEFFDAQERITPPVPDITDTCSDASDRRHLNRLSLTGNDLPSVPESEPSCALPRRPLLPDQKTERVAPKVPQPPSPLTLPSKRAEAKPAKPLPPKPPLAPKPQIVPPRSPQNHGGPYAHCNGDSSGRLSSELLEMEPDTMEFKSVASGAGGLPRITAVRRSPQPPPLPPRPPKVPENGPGGPQPGPKPGNGPKAENGPKQEDGTRDALPKVDRKTNGVSLPKAEWREGGGAGTLKRQTLLSPLPRSASGDELTLSLAVLPPLSPKPSPLPLHPLSLPATSPVSPGETLGSVSPPNGLHPWGSRNGSVQSGRRVSLSHESLSPKSTDPPACMTTSLTCPSSSSSKGAVGALDGREPGRSGSGSDLRVSSTSLGGRLPASALRGRIQSLPWYMTRSQEILGTLDYPSSTSLNGGDTSGFGSGSSALSASGASDSGKAAPAAKETEPAAIRPLEKGKALEDGAEVVIATIREAQEVAPRANGTAGGLRENVDAPSGLSSKPYGFLGTCKSEQPQSRPHSEVGPHSDVDPPCPSPAEGAPPPPAHREACGCRTVYANCFSGDGEDGCGFDEELTIYEFSRRARPPKPASPAPSPNILSLLRDTPRPLSTLSAASSELSPLLSRPVSPTGPAPVGPLRSLTDRRYGGGGLKGGFSSLRQDIDQLRLVLERGTADPPPAPPSSSSSSSSPEPTETDAQLDGAPVGTGPGPSDRLKVPEPGGGAAPCCGGGPADPLTEAERALLQAEARRLASGCQRATRVGWAPDEALRSLSNSFAALVQLSAACLRTGPCPGCAACRRHRRQGALDLATVEDDDDDDDDGDGDGGQEEALEKLKEIVGLYQEFVGAVETAGAAVGAGGFGGGGGGGGGARRGQGEGEGVRLLAKRCTVLISSVFALTQLFRSRSPDAAAPPSHAPLNF